jgi:hypothetical protein
VRRGSPGGYPANRLTYVIQNRNLGAGHAEACALSGRPVNWHTEHMRPLDTSPEAWAVFLDIQKRMTPGEKIARVFELSARVKAMAEAGLRQRYPDASDEEIRMRAIRQRLGDELFEKVYGEAALPTEPK